MSQPSSSSGPVFDIGDLDPARYDANEPLSVAKYQRVVREFISHARNDTLADDEALLEGFIRLVKREGWWQLAQAVVAEFRQPMPSADTTSGTMMRILPRLDLIPVEREKFFLTTEDTLFAQRYQYHMQYLVTGGRGRNLETPPAVARELQNMQGSNERLLKGFFRTVRSSVSDQPASTDANNT